jgi:hypothetical protein
MIRLDRKGFPVTNTTAYFERTSKSFQSSCFLILASMLQLRLGDNFIKPFSSLLANVPNKLECLLLVVFSSLV